MASNPTRFINLPAAVVAIVVRKLFDTYTGGNATSLVLPTGLQVLEEYLRSFAGLTSFNVYFFGAAATSVIYYLKKYKLLHISTLVKRSRESIACGTTTRNLYSFIRRRPRLKMNRSVRMLLHRSDKLPNLRQIPFPASRRSNILQPNLNGVSQTTIYSAPSALEAGVKPSLSSFHTTPAVINSPTRPTTTQGTDPVLMSLCSSSCTTEEEICKPTQSEARSLPLTISLDVHTPTHLQDIHGNIYEAQAMTLMEPATRKSVVDSLQINAFEGRVQPLTTATCGDCQRLHPPIVDNHVDVNCVMKNLLPEEIDLRDFKLPPRLGVKRLRVTGRRMPMRAARQPKRTPAVRSRRGGVANQASGAVLGRPRLRPRTVAQVGRPREE